MTHLQLLQIYMIFFLQMASDKKKNSESFKIQHLPVNKIRNKHVNHIGVCYILGLLKAFALHF